MSSGGRPTSAFITPKEYGDNQAKIAAAQKYLEDLTSQNEAGLRRYEELEAQKRELQKKIEEGEKAKCVMDHLQNLQPNMTRGLLEGPRHEPYQSTARIEEVPLEDSTHHGTVSPAQQHVQSNPVLPTKPGMTANHIQGSHSQNTHSYGSVPAVYSAQTNRIPMHTLSGQQQVVYPPSAVVIPQTSSTFSYAEAAASASRIQHSTHYQPISQPHSSHNVNLYNQAQPAQNVPTMNPALPSSHQPRQSVPSSVDQSWLPYSNAGQSANPTYLPPRPGKPMEFVWDKDNSAEVRLLNISPSKFPLLKSKISEFTRTAPLRTKIVIHPDMAVWKDESSVVWLYLRVEGGFWRYRNINAFFEGQERLAKSLMLPPSQRQIATMRHIPNGMIMPTQGIQTTTNKSLGLPFAQPTPAMTASQGSSSSTAAPVSNSIATGNTSQQMSTNGLGSTSTIRVPQAPISGPSTVPLPQNPVSKVTGHHAATSAPVARFQSSLAGSQPPIDKKNLSKHILFALGKRPRDVLQRSPEAGRPTKKPTLATFAAVQIPQLHVAASASESVAPMSSERPVTNIPTAAVGNTASFPKVAASTPTGYSVRANQSVPTEINITISQAASGIRNVPVPKVNDTTSPTLLPNPPSKATPASSSNTTQPPISATAPAPVPVTHPTLYNATDSLKASQPVAAIAVSSTPRYQPHFIGGFQKKQFGDLTLAAPMMPGVATIRQSEPGQSHLSGTSKGSQLANVAAHVGTLPQEQQALKQQPPPPRQEPTPSVVLKQNVHAGPSNVGTLQDPVLPFAGPSVAPPHAQSGPSDPKVSSKRRKEVYVLVPPRPPYLVAHKRRLAEKRAAHLLGEEGAKSAVLAWEREPGDSYDDPLVIGEDYNSGRDTPIDKSERESLRLSATRIDAFPCRWDRCEVVLNCAHSLLTHLKQHPPEPNPNNRSYTCRWTQCGRRCTYAEKHLENHAFLPLRCAYKNCSETFRNPAQLTKHSRSRHKNHALKPTAELQRPEPGKLPDIPGVIPAYLFVTKIVKPATISKNRHSLLLPKVVANIVDSDPEKPVKLRARKAMRSTGGQAFPPADTVRNEYDFMTARSIRYSSYLSQPVDLPFSDLNSTNISELLDEGLMLWTPDGDSDYNDDDSGDDVMFNRGGIKIEDGVQPGLEGPNAVSSISDRGHIEQRIDEEEMVASMLTQASG